MMFVQLHMYCLDYMYMYNHVYMYGKDIRNLQPMYTNMDPMFFCHYEDIVTTNWLQFPPSSTRNCSPMKSPLLDGYPHEKSLVLNLIQSPLFLVKSHEITIKCH